MKPKIGKLGVAGVWEKPDKTGKQYLAVKLSGGHMIEIGGGDAESAIHAAQVMARNIHDLVLNELVRAISPEPTVGGSMQYQNYNKGEK